MCTINKSSHTKKSLETYLMILVYLFAGRVLSLMVIAEGNGIQIPKEAVYFSLRTNTFGKGMNASSF